jgi:ABC-type branched-subunit amino acid transport system substrate-binding protein
MRVRLPLLALLALPACATARAQPDAGALRPPPPEDAAHGGAQDPSPDGRAPVESGRPLSPLESDAARAEALTARGDVVGALGAWNSYFEQDGVREHERAFARVRADELASRLPPETALSVWQSGSPPLARAAVGLRGAAALRARGDESAARRVEEDANGLRQSMGWARTTPWVGQGDPRRIGLSVPLSGRTAVVGEEVLRGAMMALGEARPLDDRNGGFELAVRDSAPERERAGRTAQELAREEAVIGIVGTSDGPAIGQASGDGVPFLALGEQAPGASTTAFQVLHAADSGAAALARRAIAGGIRAFAIFGPDNATGKRLADAFAAAVDAGGGRVVSRVAYVAGSTTFTAPIAQLKKATFEAVFVPDDAGRLELVAPALAAADLVPQPLEAFTPARGQGARRPTGQPGPRNVLLLSTARLLSRQLVKNAGRYVQGALLAPGYFPDANDPRGGRFVEKFRELFNREPIATDAYAYDAVRALLSVVERGAKSRADVLRALQSERFEGITGTLQFGPNHGRIDPSPVYVVTGEEIRAVR